MNFQEIIMTQVSKDCSKRILVSVISNTLNENMNFTLPTKYYEKAHNIMVKIYPYLYRDHGQYFLQFFSTKYQ